jgi:hypothetical protein
MQHPPILKLFLRKNHTKDSVMQNNKLTSTVTTIFAVHFRSEYAKPHHTRAAMIMTQNTFIRHVTAF